MSRLLITTIRRHSSMDEPSGHVMELDLDQMTKVRQVPVVEPPYRDRDPNPRGGLRGGRGICFDENSAWIANNSAVFGYDAAWNLQHTISHPSCCSIHEIGWHDQSLWIASAANDLLFRFIPNGEILQVLNMREQASLAELLAWDRPNLLSREEILSGAHDFRHPELFPRKHWDGAHVNSFCFLQDKSMMVMLGMITNEQTIQNRSEQKRLKKRDSSKWIKSIRKRWNKLTGSSFSVTESSGLNAYAVIVVQQDSSVDLLHVTRGKGVPAHNLLPDKDGSILLNDTAAHELVRIDSKQGQVIEKIPLEKGFVRGLVRKDDKHVHCR